MSIMIRNTEKPKLPATWKGVKEVRLYTRLNDELKSFVDVALKNKVPIHSMNDDAKESMDSYITGANT
jgi:hypothetical protein